MSGLDSRHVRKGHRMTTAGRAENRDTTANGLPPSPRHSRDARQIPPGQSFAPGAAVLGSQAGLRAVGAPWWTICLLGTIGLAVVGLQIVFPQDSPDKVAWWSERRRTRRHCQRRRCPCPHETALPGNARRNFGAQAVSMGQVSRRCSRLPSGMPRTSMPPGGAEGGDGTEPDGPFVRR